MRLLLILLSLSIQLISIESYAQYYGSAPMPLNIKSTGLSIDSLDYHIVEIVDEREDQSKVAEVFFGVLNHWVYLYLKKGIAVEYGQFLDRGLRFTKQGDQQIKIAFTELSINEKYEELQQKGGRLRHYKIAVEYYMINDSGEFLIMKDSLNESILAKPSKNDLSNYSYKFFHSSLKKLNKTLSSGDSYKTNAKVEKKTLKEPLDSTSKIYEGQVVLLNKQGQLFIKEADLPDFIQKAIKDEMSESLKGKYWITYNINGKEDKVESIKLTTTKYKQSSVSPFWYITVPGLLILGIISGMNG